MSYEYFIGTLVLLVVWIILFLLRKDIRKEIIILSIIFGFAGLIIDPIYSSDWWFPETITGTIPGIESFLFGFSVAGIASVIYVEIFKRKLKKTKTKKKEKIRNHNLLLLLLLCGGIFLISYFILKLNSFYSSFPAFLIPILIIWIKRKDLIINSIISGFLLTIISFIFYWVPEIISPGWIQSTWNFNMISGLTVFKVPLEDLIWFYLTGLFIGPLYEYWQERKLVKIKN